MVKEGVTVGVILGIASPNCFAQSEGSQPLINPVAISIAGRVMAFCQATL
jgi:hypothetical protein